MAEPPLTALLSQALVAFTVEADNEFERRMPHRTTSGPDRGNRPAGPWLVSMAMWFNCLRHLDDGGIALADLERRCGLQTNLRGMHRWGYITVEPGRVVRPTRRGREAREAWRPLPDEIEGRWAERFGAAAVGRLRDALGTLLGGDERFARLPDFLPILGYGLSTRRGLRRVERAPDPAGSDAGLVALLARALLGFALAFERDAPLSLAMSADVVRVIEPEGVHVKDLPRRGGVSKEAIAMGLGFLERRQLAVVGPDPQGGRHKRARLTAEGLQARRDYADRLAGLERAAARRAGHDTIAGLRAALAPIVIGPAGDGSSPLWRGLDPYPDGWRASVPRPETLPHFPMVLHRGGYPDGA